MTTDQWPPERTAAHFEQIEREMLQPGNWGISWVGISFKFVRGALRDGCTLQRGRTYGRIEYTILASVEGVYRYREVSREQALAEALKPWPLRRAEMDLQDVILCQVCGCAGIGQDDRKHWDRLRYDRPAGIKREGLTIVLADGSQFQQPGELVPTYDHLYLDVCHDCIRMIAEGVIRRRPEP